MDVLCLYKELNVSMSFILHRNWPRPNSRVIGRHLTDRRQSRRFWPTLGSSAGATLALAKSGLCKCQGGSARVVRAHPRVDKDELVEADPAALAGAGAGFCQIATL